MSETPPRPSHTTLAAGLVIGGSVGVVLGVAQQLSGLNSLDTRESVAAFLSEPPGSGLSLDVTGALRLLRVALMAVAGCATAAAVLGFHVLRGSRRARVGLSALAGPIFLGGLATGGFLTSLVAAASVLLWVGPSGAWFRGESPTSAAAASGRAVGARQPRPGSPPPVSDPAPGRLEGQPVSGDREPLPPVPPTVGDGAGPRRPDALVWACVITWASCAVVLVVLLVSAVLMSTNPDLVIDELRRQGRGVPDADVDLLRTTTFMTVALAGTWSVVAAVVAALAYRGVRRARLALLVSAAAAAVLSLLAVLSTVLALVPGAVCLATVVLLSRPEVRAWSRHGART